ALSWQVPRRIDRRAAAGAAADGARLLRAGRDRQSKPARAALSIVVWAPVAIYLRGSGRRLGGLQPAVRGAADGGVVQPGRSQPAQRVGDFGGVADAHFF